MEYDLIVIGSGSGGLGAALGMHKLGFKVMLIDKNAGSIGGECLNTGCVPSKVLLHVAKQVHNGRGASQFGPQITGAVDIHKVKEYIHQKQERIRTYENPGYLREQGVEVVLGTASFVSNDELQVNNEIYKGRNIIIATGSSPGTVEIKGAENIPVFTHESVFDINFLPEKFVFLGAGPVSIEMAQAFSRLGSAVSVVVRGERILEKEDPEISEILLKKLQQEGISFYFNSEVIRIENGKTAILKGSSGKKQEIPANAVFMGLGRTLNFDSLKLENAGIQTKEGKIVLNNKLQTSNKQVFVCGDAADNLKFSHAAEMHNMLLINNFVSPLKKKLNLDHFPWVTFTDPEVATFGLNEERLRERKIPYERLETKLDKTDRAITDDYEYAKLILFIEKKRLNPANAKVLGGSMIAPNAGEITQELVLANIAGIKIKQFVDKVYAYPTAANINKEIVLDRLLQEIRPWMRKMLRTWYRFRS